MNTACGNQSYSDMNVDEFEKLIAQPDVQLLDVRTAEEYAQGHIAGAMLADVKLDNFEQSAASQLDTARTVAVYCRSGKRSADAASRLSQRGYKVVNLLGGIMAWQEQDKPVTTEGNALYDEFTTNSGKKVKLYPLIHASLRLVLDGKELHIDPVSKLGDRTTDYATMPTADLLLVTHEHGDHLDKDAITALTGGETVLITNQRCANILGTGRVMANGDAMDVDDLHIQAVPAYNTTDGHLQFHPKGRDNGFVLTFDGLRIYIAGDTEDIPEMAQLKDIDIALLPCNQPYTMTVEQLVCAARVIKPKVLYPYHYGKTDISGLPAMLQGDGIEVRLRPWD